jgi:hypothetical protein
MGSSRALRERRVEMETKVHPEATAEVDVAADAWFEPPPANDGEAASYEQLELPERVRTLTSEEQLKLRETLKSVSLVEAELPLTVEQLRARIDEWTTATERGDRLLAARLAVVATHQLHRIAVAADRAGSQVAAGRVREAAKWWTFQVLAVLDSIRRRPRPGASKDDRIMSQG